MTLEEYAKQNPMQEPEREREAIRANAQKYMDKMQDMETVRELKESILQQLEQGNAPEIILYTALRTIGILSHDEEWTEAGRAILDRTYSDLAQQSIFADRAIETARRLETMKIDYNDKLRRQLNRNLIGYRRIEKALQEALQELEAIEPQDDIMTGCRTTPEGHATFSKKV